jgi:Icc-related predicted phosphoesterase
MEITIISDTHGKHHEITDDLIGGDLLIHCGDAMTSGYREKELVDFCKWFDGINSYDCKVFIAGNHCRLFEDNPEKAMEIVNSYKTVNYLQDEYLIFNGVKIYGSPWQPEFYNWAFNLPRNGQELEEIWSKIPMDTDILITHTPPKGILDVVQGQKGIHLGCEQLRKRIDIVRPKISCAGHLHTGNGYLFQNETHFFNASVLDERYDYVYKPKNFMSP